MNISGFKLINIEHYTKYNLFMTFEKTINNETNNEINNETNNDVYTSNKELFINVINKKLHFVNSIIDEINNYKNKYIFSCHVNTQILLNMGLNKIHFNGILDNDNNKQNNKLYGYDLLTYSPNIITNMNDIVIVVDMGIYTNEICEQLLQLNNNCVIISQ